MGASLIKREGENHECPLKDEGESLEQSPPPRTSPITPTPALPPRGVIFTHT
jgi:hypothetical protein